VSSSLLLAKRLRACDDAALHALITSRLSGTSGLRDFFDVADALLTREAVLAALSRQPRSIYDDLRQNLASDSRPAATQTFLDVQLLNTSEGSAQLCPELVSALESLYVAEPAPPASLAESLTVVIGTPEAAAIESSLATISSLDEIARLVRDTPLKELARGGLNSGDTARLNALMPSPEVTAMQVLSLGALGGILSKQQGVWLVHENLDEWLELDAPSRWQHLATAWIRNQPDMVVHVLGSRIGWGPELDDYLLNEFPVDHS
jgi:hypothetical protein